MVSDDVKRVTTPVTRDVFRLSGHDVPMTSSQSNDDVMSESPSDVIIEAPKMVTSPRIVEIESEESYRNPVLIQNDSSDPDSSDEVDIISTDSRRNSIFSGIDSLFMTSKIIMSHTRQV